MPPPLALLLTTAFVAFLFWRDVRERPPVTGALWIPLLWMLIIGSRFVSEWLSLGGTFDTPSDLAEGSPLDRGVFLGLELAGLYVLYRRRISWSTVISRNVWLAIFLAYCALSLLWSEFPLVAFKRWVKVLGHPIMALIVATEPDPREAVLRLMKRSAYVLVPFSIMLIKYYPELGRGFGRWTGEAFNTGVTTNKNALGYVGLLLGFFFFWHLVTTLRGRKGPAWRNELLLGGTFLCMIAWLLYMANSATSLMALMVGISTVLFLGLRSVNKRHVGVYLVTGLLLLSGVELVFGVIDTAIQAVGRDATLTGRVELWEGLLRFHVNPLLGAGFESFWLGERAEVLWARYWWRPNQAHNGYLETYLNLGWVGVILLAGWIFAAFRKAHRTLLSDFSFGRFQMGLLAIVVVYNYTEATFKALHLVWFALYIIGMDYARPRTVPLERTVDSRLARSRVGRQIGRRARASSP